MSNLLEIMDKKSCGKSEIYISEEDGRWYACYPFCSFVEET